jgi:hypothetical protein
MTVFHMLRLPSSGLRLTARRFRPLSTPEMRCKDGQDVRSRCVYFFLINICYKLFKQFHFATILSPWTRRALIAGGFGIGIRPGEAQPDFVAAVPYRDGGDIGAEIANDVESGASKKTDEQYIVETPFFHLDLYTAVQVAECGFRS